MSFNASPPPSTFCGNCNFHGFPCLNCAEYEFFGNLGPGYLEQQRWICENNDPKVQLKMEEIAESKGIEYGFITKDNYYKR